jgi:hypothetical protein
MNGKMFDGLVPLLIVVGESLWIVAFVGLPWLWQVVKPFITGKLGDAAMKITSC